MDKYHYIQNAPPPPYDKNDYFRDYENDVFFFCWYFIWNGPLTSILYE